MLGTIRGKLIASFVFLMLMILLCGFLLFRYYSDTRREIQSVTKGLNQLEVLILKSQNAMQDFFLVETVNPAFFRTGQSDYLSKLRAARAEIKSLLSVLGDGERARKFSLEAEMERLNHHLELWNGLFDETTALLIDKGFKDDGVEGKFRTAIHELEKFSEVIDRVDILQLRRHEKDFILRNEADYVRLHSALLGKIRSDLQERAHSFDRDSLLSLLSAYEQNFGKFVQLEKKIGLKAKDGLKNQLDQQLRLIEIGLKSTLKMALIKEGYFLGQLETRVLLLSMGTILAGLFFALVISVRVSRKLVSLRDEISHFIESGFTTSALKPVPESRDEVDSLTARIATLEKTIKDHISALRETNGDLETFLYRVSHDLKGPLSSISGLLHLIETTNEKEDKDAYFEMIKSSVKKLNETIDELNDVILIRQGKAVLQRANFRTLAQEVISMVKYVPEAAKVEYEIQVAGNEEIYSDIMMLRIILKNLVENAVKYSRKNLEHPFVKISLEDSGNGHLNMVVTDNGIGIPPELQEKIFDMFFRGTNESKGSGLGLYIVKNAITRMEGSISVHSEVNHGTVFSVSIPRHFSGADQ